MTNDTMDYKKLFFEVLDDNQKLRQELYNLSEQEEFELNYCEKCIQMTNWKNEECCKCSL